MLHFVLIALASPQAKLHLLITNIKLNIKQWGFSLALNSANSSLLHRSFPPSNIPECLFLLHLEPVSIPLSLHELVMPRDASGCLAFAQCAWDCGRLALRLEGAPLHLLLMFDGLVVLLHYWLVFLLLVTPLKETVVHFGGSGLRNCFVVSCVRYKGSNPLLAG